MKQNSFIFSVSQPLRPTAFLLVELVVVLAVAVSNTPTFAAGESERASTPPATPPSTSSKPSKPSETSSPSASKQDSSNPDDALIRGLLQKQADDWNKGNLDQFVEGYKKSEDTLFVGATGIKRGSKAILERYKSAYPDREAMGHLTFSDLEVHLTCANSAYAVGEFRLEMANKEHGSGFFTLNLIKSDGRWEIVADHTTAQ
jgi:ketosteroid isomerase-like protein